MKKILLLIYLLLCNRVYAIENIIIDNNELIPPFDKNINVYNYYTNKETIKIIVDKKEELITLNEEKTTLLFDNYTINIFKNYSKNNNKAYLKNISILGHNINFDKDNYDYYIEVDDEEENLCIDYELSNDNAYVLVTGNGNFNKSENIVTINVNDEYKYKIHVLKTMNVSKTIKVKKEKIVIKKEIAKFIIITISCTLIFLFSYLMIHKTNFYI